MAKATPKELQGRSFVELVALERSGELSKLLNIRRSEKDMAIKKTFQQMVEERVQQKLEDAIEKAANEQIASMLRTPMNGSRAPDTGSYKRRIEYPKNTIIALGDQRKFAVTQNTQHSQVYESVLKVLGTGPARRDDVARFVCQELGCKINLPSALIGKAIRAGAFVVVGHAVDGFTR